MIWRRPGDRTRGGGRLRPRGRRRDGHRHCRTGQCDARGRARDPRGIGGDRAHGRSRRARWLEARLDQRDLPALRAAAEEARAAFGRLDILFANAGIQTFKPILDWQDADWQDTIDVNLTGTCNAIRAVAPHLVRNGGGRIIVTSSTQGRHGTKFGAAYSASKWGIIGLMKSAALELGVHKITVNAVIPGLIDTPLTRHRQRYAQAVDDLDSTQPTAVLEAEAKTNSAQSRRSGSHGSSPRRLRQRLCSSRPTRPTW